MARLEVNLNSTNGLSRMTTFTALVPDSGKGPFPVLYLLHGLSDDHTAWTRKTIVERMLAGIPLIVIMPDGGRGHYTDSKSAPRDGYETAIMQGLIPFVDNTFNTIPKGNKRLIAGLSMGGYGALKLGMKHPDQFAGALSFSGAFNFGHTNVHVEPQKTIELEAIFGKKLDPQNDVFALAKTLNSKKMPALHFDCGLDDFTLSLNQKLHQHLTKLKIPHQYEEHHGTHNWNYWNTGLLRMIPWMLKTLKVDATFDRKNFI
jgi:S-formylglutathione hydrolase FrmB